MSYLFDDEDLKRAQTVVTHLVSHSGLSASCKLGNCRHVRCLQD